MAPVGKRMTNKQRVTVTERETMVLELAKAGRTFRQIAADVGYTNPSSAYQAFQRALKKTLQPVADEYRELHRTRLEHIIRVHWPGMNRGEPVATNLVLKAMGDLANLEGLNAAKEVKVLHDLQPLAERVAADLGLNAADVLAEAERIMAGTGAPL